MSLVRIAVISQKGGTGKTTTAINLAVAATLDGKRVLVADLDPIANATKWYKDRSADAKAGLVVQPTHSAGLPELEKIAREKGIDWLIFDTAAGTDMTASRAVESSDMVILTCRPSTFDRDATPSAVRLCRVHERTPRVLLTQTETRGPETEEVRESLTRVGLDVLPCVTTHLKAYHRSVKTGQGVLEYDPSSKAAEEVTALYRLVCKHADVAPRHHGTMVPLTRAKRGAPARSAVR